MTETQPTTAKKKEDLKTCLSTKKSTTANNQVANIVRPQGGNPRLSHFAPRASTQPRSSFAASTMNFAPRPHQPRQYVQPTQPVYYSQPTQQQQPAPAPAPIQSNMQQFQPIQQMTDYSEQQWTTPAQQVPFQTNLNPNTPSFNYPTPQYTAYTQSHQPQPTQQNVLSIIPIEKPCYLYFVESPQTQSTFTPQASHLQPMTDFRFMPATNSIGTPNVTFQYLQ